MRQTLSNFLFRAAILALSVSFASGGYFLLTPIKDYVTTITKELKARIKAAKG
ncbi:hypothetical protein V8E54_007583 [Elaphomyces granulatus]